MNKKQKIQFIEGYNQYAQLRSLVGIRRGTIKMQGADLVRRQYVKSQILRILTPDGMFSVESVENIDKLLQVEKELDEWFYARFLESLEPAVSYSAHL